MLRLNPIQQQNPEERRTGVSILLMARNTSIVVTGLEHEMLDYGVQESQDAEISLGERAAKLLWSQFKQGT